MGLLLFFTANLMLWIVLWAINVATGLDAMLLPLVFMLIAFTVHLVRRSRAQKR